MRFTRLFFLLLAGIPAGCALTPQGEELVHPERRAPTVALPPRDQYLKECTDRVQMAFQNQADDFWERRKSDVRKHPRSDRPELIREPGQPTNLILASFEIVADGGIEKLDIQFSRGKSSAALERVQAAFAETHLRPMPLAVAAECGGHLPHQVWVNDWVF